MEPKAFQESLTMAYSVQALSFDTEETDHIQSRTASFFMIGKPKPQLRAS
jgi:hypothetical protein